MKIELGKTTMSGFTKAYQGIVTNKIKNIDIYPARNSGELIKFSELMPGIYQLFKFESIVGLWLFNFPYCVVNENSQDHIIAEDHYRGEKMKQCQGCKRYSLCPGFPRGYFNKFSAKELKPIPDIPVEVMLEIESRCNSSCSFCFNKNSFANKKRDKNKLSTVYIKKIIDQIVKAGIKKVRFTGGEPLLRDDLELLLGYAKKKGLYVLLNTNATLFTRARANKLAGLIDNVLISVENYLEHEEEKTTGIEKALTKKIKAIKCLKAAGAPFVRVSTVATKKNINRLEKISSFILSLPIDEWESYRPISNQHFKADIDNDDVNKLVKKLAKIKEKTTIPIAITNALPICSMADVNLLNSLAIGGLLCDGHERIVVDPRGFVKPHYYIDNNIGDPLNLLSAWQHPFMKKMRNYGFLPKKCFDCRFKYKCQGGSRHEAKLAFGSYDSMDPLAQTKFRVKI